MKKVLLLEDDRFLIRMYKVLLEKKGYEVHMLENGGDALSVSKNTKPDIVVLDIIMPKMDGYAVVEELKKDPQTKNIPLVILTNLSQDEDKKRMKDHGVNVYLVKSHISFTEVVNIIEKNIT